MTLSPLPQQPLPDPPQDRRSGHDRRAAPSPLCRILLVWNNDADVNDLELGRAHAAAVQAAADLGIDALVTPRQLDWDEPSQNDEELLDTTNGLLWLVGNDASLNRLLTKAAIDRDIPLLRLTKDDEDAKEFSNTGLAALSQTVLTKQDAMANDAVEPLRHFLARAQSRVAALRSDVMARLANTHARLIEKFGGNTEKPQAD
ncbi:MAG: hypothetical protein QF471_01520, partial [Phycisphaerales bacterium]|nr:hypothetical protein [Phycisphaerales bacterium]